MDWQAAEMQPRERIIVALDFPTSDEALALVRRLSPHPGLFKIGLQLYTAAGPEIVRAVCALGGRIFLDLKLHDIPNTVGRAVQSADSLGVEMFTLRRSGGPAMLAAAVQSAAPGMLLLGVTVLTSADEATLRETGVDSSMENQVLRLAKLGVEAGIGGLVASPHEVKLLRDRLRGQIQLVVPGVRPAWAEKADQKRVMTPAEALRAGADYLVIGRPITGHRDPAEAIAQICDELS